MACTVNKKAFCVLEFAKTESIVTVQRRFRTMYRTEPPTDKTIPWVVHEIRAEWLPVRCETKRPAGAIGRDCRACARNVCQEPSEVNISSTCKVEQKNGVSLPLLTCSPSAWPSRLLYRRGRKSRRDLRITLYIPYGRVVLYKLIVAHMIEFSVCYVIPRFVAVFGSSMNPVAFVHNFFKNIFLGAFARLL